MNVEQARTISKNALDELAAVLERGKSDDFLEYLATLARFHRYSPRNVMLIRHQRSNSTQVCGFSTWKRLGRAIMRGQRGIAILAPIPRRALHAPEEREDNEENKRDREQLDLGVTGCRTAYVFDIQQTIGAPPARASMRGR